MSQGRDIPDTTKQEAAELAVLHSSQSGGAKVAVDTTEVKNIWKANGAKPGMVLYEVYTTVYVTPRPGWKNSCVHGKPARGKKTAKTPRPP